MINLKTIKSFIGLAFVLFASFFVLSCNDEVEETFEQQWASVLDNHDSNYDYSDDGKCFGDGGGISKENFDKVIVGHGWKHYCLTIKNTFKSLAGHGVSNLLSAWFTHWE